MTEWSIIIYEKFIGFCKYFINKVMVLYNDVERVLKINGALLLKFLGGYDKVVHCLECCIT